MDLDKFPPVRVIKAGFSNTTIKRRFRERVKTSDYHNFQFAFSGIGTCVIDGTPYSLSAGRGVFVFPGEKYVFQDCDDRFGQFFCHFEISSSKDDDSSNRFRDELGGSRLVEPDFFTMVKYCREVLHHSTSDIKGISDSLYSSGWFMILLGHIFESSIEDGTQESIVMDPEIRMNVAKARKYIEQHFSESISVKELARSSGISVGYFSKLFAANTSFTPHQYVLHCRIEYAKLRLAENLSPIKDIAENAGFREPAHFNHTFKKWTGVTPASYRKQSLRGSENASTDIRD